MVAIVKPKMTVLNPVAERMPAGRDLAPRSGGINSKRIGLLSNGVTRSIDFDRIEELIRERYQPAEIVKRRKPNRCAPSPLALIDELAAKCDLVMGGVCG